MTVRVGLIGIGVNGRNSAKRFANKTPGASLVAVCDIDPKALAWAQEEFGDTVQRCSTVEELLPHVDAVKISTPHYDHPPIAIQCLEAGKHVLIEKPAGSYTRQVLDMNAAAEAHPDLVFAINFQHRFRPDMQLIRDLVQGGELGRIRRINWIITTWFRSQHYYNTGGWRATWAGEGGGVLLNQAPHQLDLWQWIFGMPQRVRSFCSFGKYHHIEVEDEATAYMEYADGATGVFITSTAENPGTDRLEITGDRGRLVYENGAFDYQRTKDSVRWAVEEGRSSAWGGPSWPVQLESGSRSDHGPGDNFIDAITTGTELVTPGVSGINECLLANAMIKSAWDDAWIELGSFDHDGYKAQLDERIANSTYEKPDVAEIDYSEVY
ncbi:MAG: Gfo/Idh/MocA family protein [Planctomycetota bacterium]